jgi:hypothetical protein
MGARDIKEDPPWSLVRGRPAVLLLASQVALALVIAVTTGLLVVHLHDFALTEADHEQRRLTLVLADQADRAFEAVELVQTALAERLEHDGVHTPEGFQRYMSGSIMHDELRGRGRMLPQLDAITVIDADGNLINSSRPLLGPGVNVADREYYKALVADRDRTTFISGPLRNRTNGKWTAYLALRVAEPGGEFLGLILGAIRLGYFEELYHSVALGPRAALDCAARTASCWRTNLIWTQAQRRPQRRPCSFSHPGRST